MSQVLEFDLRLVKIKELLESKNHKKHVMKKTFFLGDFSILTDKRESYMISPHQAHAPASSTPNYSVSEARTGYKDCNKILPFCHKPNYTIVLISSSTYHFLAGINHFALMN